MVVIFCDEMRRVLVVVWYFSFRLEGLLVGLRVYVVLIVLIICLIGIWLRMSWLMG